MAEHRLYGLIAEFESAQALLDAGHKTFDAGYRRTDGFSPFPVEGLSQVLGKKPSILPWLVFGGGVAGGSLGFLVQTFATVYHYPLNIGGKPYFSWPAYLPAAYEMTILGAAATAVLGMLLLNQLPMPYHPVFHVPQFEKASSHRFFILVEAKDPKFDAGNTRRFLEGLHPVGVYDVPE